jgi:hypothetical protein
MGNVSRETSLEQWLWGWHLEPGLSTGLSELDTYWSKARAISREKMNAEIGGRGGMFHVKHMFGGRPFSVDV